MTDATLPTAAAAPNTVERAAHAFATVEQWMSSDPMAGLLGLFDQATAAPPADWTSWLHLNEELPEWLEAVFQAADSVPRGLTPDQVEVLRRTLSVERTAAAHFNFRTRDGSGYRERSQAVDGAFSQQTRARVLALTTELGLVEARPPRFASYEKTLVLGGGYRSPLLRARLAARFRATGVDLGEISFLGSPRFLIEDPPEHVATAEYAPEATDEFGLMIGAVRAEFGLAASEVTFLCGCPSADQRCPKWLAQGAEGADETPPAYTHERQATLIESDGRVIGSVLSASTGRPPYRPDTSDTFGLWARCAQPRLGQRVLVVTTQVFVPFQTFDGLRRLYLPFGVDLDTVGLGTEYADRPLTTEYLLQETLSAIRSARRLLVDAAETLMSTPT
ncbi:hypothetical protein [Phytohabitans rumicis]|uniref:hypothetical protein n=1 Tax=Phytohabitans rumicis TaxID=1076125 RepID=UPI0031EFDD5B